MMKRVVTAEVATTAVPIDLLVTGTASRADPNEYFACNRAASRRLSNSKHPGHSPQRMTCSNPSRVIRILHGLRGQRHMVPPYVLPTIAPWSSLQVAANAALGVSPATATAPHRRHLICRRIRSSDHPPTYPQFFVDNSHCRRWLASRKNSTMNGGSEVRISVT